jgi:hypothetical protein
MRHCRGDVELHQGALERRRRGGVTIESGVSSAYHVMQNSGGGRKNGRGVAVGPDTHPTEAGGGRRSKGSWWGGVRYGVTGVWAGPGRRKENGLYPVK